MGACDIFHLRSTDSHENWKKMRQLTLLHLIKTTLKAGEFKHGAGGTKTTIKVTAATRNQRNKRRHFDTSR